MIVSITCIGLLLGNVAFAGFWKSEAVPTRLRCEYLANPLGINGAKPNLGWMMEAGDLQAEVRGQRQTAYQVLVASTPERLAKEQGDVWDSGKVVSERSTHVTYDGKPLAPSTYFFWKVRVWDAAGRSSAWSEPARFLTGMRAWQGKWIGATEQSTEGSGVLGFAVEGKAADEVKWVQVDLGSSKPLERVVLHPMRHNDPAVGAG